MAKTKLYIPQQVAAISFFGGPVAAFYVLKTNFSSMNIPDLAQKTMALAFFIIPVFFLALPLLDLIGNEKISGLIVKALPLLICLISYAVSKKMQLSKNVILKSDLYETQTFGNAIKVILLSWVFSVPLYMLYKFMFSIIGIVPMPPPSP